MTSRLALSLSALSLAALLGGCEDEKIPNIQPYVRPASKTVAAGAPTTCEALAREHPERKWAVREETLQISEGSALVVSDPSVLGGPFEPALRIEVPTTEASVRVLLTEDPKGVRPLCVQVRLSDKEATSWKPLGDVVIDTDMLALVDERRALAAVRAEGAVIAPGIDAPADDLPRIASALAPQGMKLEPVLTTFWSASRPVLSTDKELVRETLERIQAPGRLVLEPRQPAWPYAKALLDAQFAQVVIDDGAPHAAVGVEVSLGDGAYVVSQGLDEQGAVAQVEVRLE